MMDLQLDIDEGILLQTTEVTRYTDKEIHCQEIYLTNKNIICVCEKSNGLFKKPDTYIESIHLDTIKVINGFAQVLKIDDDNYGFGMQILFKNGKREYFAFCDNDKVISRWINTVKGAVTGSIRTVEDITNTTTDRKNNKAKIFAGVSGVLSMDVNSIIDKASKKITEFTEEMPHKIVNKLDQTIDSFDEPIEQVDVQPENDAVVEPITDVFSEEVNSNATTEDASNNISQKQSEEKKFIFCSNCGEKLIKGSKFCSNCGSPIGIVVAKEKTEIKQETVKSETAEQIHVEEITERKTVYDGKIYKCPNCGEVLKSFVSNCPLCGYELRQINVSDSIKEFALRLENSKGDEQRLILIKNFPIPNTKEDVFEFMIMASTNICSNLSKKTYIAWQVKFEQSYQKAKLLFDNDTEFAKIQKIYDDTKKKINTSKLFQGIKSTGQAIIKTGSFFSRAINIILKNIFVLGGIILYLKAIQSDRGGENGIAFEFLGGLLLITSSIILLSKNVTYVDIAIGALSGICSLYLSNYLVNGSGLELFAFVVFVFVFISFIKKTITIKRERD